MLTSKQSLVLQTIKQLTQQMGYLPTLEEIGQEIGIGRSTVHKHIRTLINNNYLQDAEGKAAYRLNQDWVEVEAGDFMWLRAFCPQACIATGNTPFRYLLYKDVNRHPDLVLP